MFRSGAVCGKEITETEGERALSPNNTRQRPSRIVRRRKLASPTGLFKIPAITCLIGLHSPCWLQSTGTNTCTEEHRTNLTVVLIGHFTASLHFMSRLGTEAVEDSVSDPIGPRPSRGSGRHVTLAHTRCYATDPGSDSR